jgi:peptide/nickel transport system permease protein
MSTVTSPRRLGQRPAQAPARKPGQPAKSTTGESPAVQGPTGQPPASPMADDRHEILGRSPGRLALNRLVRDRVGMVSGAIVAFFILVAVMAPLIEKLYGLGPTVNAPQGLDRSGLPIGGHGGIDFTSNNPTGHAHILGLMPQTGWDLFMQLVYGSRTSLGIAFTSAIAATVIGIVFGVVAGYLGGWADAAISWFIDYMMAFPFILLAIAAIPVVNTLIADQYGDVSATKRVITIVIIFSLFGWMSTARLVRGEVLSLRERDYVDAARAAGASGAHIMFREILPNLWGPILVTFSLSVPATITGEAALSFLNIGVIQPTPDFGRMINDSIKWLPADPLYTLIPGFAIFALVLTFNLFGDSLRDALDPRSVR